MSRPKLAGIIVVAGLALAGLGTYIGMRKFRLYQEHWQCWSELDELGSALIFRKRVPSESWVCPVTGVHYRLAPSPYEYVEDVSKARPIAWDAVPHPSDGLRLSFWSDNTVRVAASSGKPPVGTVVGNTEPAGPSAPPGAPCSRLGHGSMAGR